jgi:hypothetical protein
LNKRIGAAFIIMLFALGIVSIPVSAHFTLGDLTATYRFHANDYDKHVAGVVGYVWPGMGYTSAATSLGIAKPDYPGYQSPYPGWNPGQQGTGYGGATGTGATGYPSAWYQLDSNNYAPFGAILANTIKPGTAFASTWWGNPTIEGLPLEQANSRGDLLFGFNATGLSAQMGLNYTELFLFVPPEFTNIKASRVVTSWTNNYDSIRVDRANLDRNLDDWFSLYAPGWTCVRVRADRGYYYNTSYTSPVDGTTVYGGQKDPALGAGIWYYPRVMNFTQKNEWYYLSLNDVIAPAISGRYFFKVAFRSCNETIVNRVQAGATAGNGMQDWFFNAGSYIEWMPIENWPVLTVKGEIDPAIVTGFIKFGGWNTTLYGQNVTLPGRVRAVGIADDPYTGKTLGKPVEARGYFNQTARGHYEVEGVAPGVYDIYASCAGYPEMKIASGVKIQKGQSYHIDGYLTPGAVVHGTAYSKCGTGEVVWGTDQNIRIEIYAASKTTAAEVEAVKPASTMDALAEDVTKAYDSGSLTKTKKMPVTWSPNVGTTFGQPSTYIASPLTAHYILKSSAAVTEIQFPWYFPKVIAGYTETAATWPFTPYNTAMSKLGYDAYGVGPKQKWTTGAGTSFFWRFGDRGKYGAPSDWSGMVPQYNATWTNGLPAGQYYVRGWTLGYVQLQADGVTFEHAPFTIASAEFPGDIDVPFDLRKSSTITKYIHFHAVPGTLVELGTGAAGTTNQYLPRNLGYKIGLGKPSTTAYAWRVRVYATDSAGFDWGYTGSLYTPTGNYPAPISGRDESTLTGRSYGIPPGDYKLRDLVEGWVQDPAEFWVSVGLCGTSLVFSNHVYRGVGFNVTLFAKDWEHPTVDQPWKYDNDLAYVGVYKDGALVGLMWSYTKKTAKAVPINITNWYDDRHMVDTAASIAWDTGLYELKAFVYGYVQKKPVQIYATRGSLADILIKVEEGAQIPVTMKFKHESIYDNFHWNSSMRVRVFNDANNLVGEYLTSDPWHGYLGYDSATGVTSQDPFKVKTGYTLATSPLDDHEMNYVPGVTTTLNFTICGIPDLRKQLNKGYGTNSLDPVFNIAQAGWKSSTVVGPYGIDAAPNYMGTWRVEVDVVPWYGPAAGYTTTTKGTFFPFPPGVLYGESPRGMGVGGTYIPENHYGPWALNFPIVAPSNHLGGEASLYFELDLRGSMSGQVLGYTWCDDWRPTSWASVVFTGADGKVVEKVSSFDGRYFAYLPTGQYSMTIQHGGYVSPKTSVYNSDGGSGLRNFPLERANVPIPEFPVAAVVLAFSLAASLFILRRRRK